MKTMVLGLGNPIFSDDGVGLRVADELKKQILDKDITIESAELAGINMLETLSGYDRVVIIDAIQTGGQAGRIFRLKPEDLKSTIHTSTPHDINFATALEYGERIGIQLPARIDIIAIEIPEATYFGETLSAEIAEAVGEAVRIAKEMLRE